MPLEIPMDLIWELLKVKAKPLGIGEDDLMPMEPEQLPMRRSSPNSSCNS